MSLRKLEKFFLGATLFCIPFGTGAVFNAVMSADLVMVTDVFLFCLYAMWIYRTDVLTTITLRFGKIAFYAILMLVWSVLSMTSAIALTATGIGIFFGIKAFLLYFYLVNNIKTKADLIFVANMLVFAMLFQGLLGTLQGVLGRTLGLGFLGERQMLLHKVESRVRGTLAYPNRYGLVLVLILPLAISLAVFAKRSLYKWVLAAASGLAMLGLFFSLSRSSWAGFLLSMMVFTILLFRRGLMKPKFFAAMAMVLVAAAAIAIINWDTIEARFETGSDGRFRTRMIQIAYPIILANPIFGVGLNNYQWHSFDDFNFWHPVHNEFLRFAAEIGIPGALMFVALLFVFLREAYRNIMIKDPLINAVAIGTFCGVIAFIVCINIGPEYQHYRIKLVFWTLAGLTFALRQVKIRELRAKKKKQQMQEQMNKMKMSVDKIPVSESTMLPMPGARRI